MTLAVQLTAVFQMRVAPSELRRWRAAARRDGLAMSAWLRRLADLASSPPAPSVPPVVGGDQLELGLKEKKKR